MRKLLSLLLAWVLFITPVIITHEHDENCGYNPETKTGCIYEVNPCAPKPDEEGPKK